MVAGESLGEFNAVNFGDSGASRLFLRILLYQETFDYYIIYGSGARGEVCDELKIDFHIKSKSTNRNKATMFERTDEGKIRQMRYPAHRQSLALLQYSIHI